jgi:hypothetical protein
MLIKLDFSKIIVLCNIQEEKRKKLWITIRNQEFLKGINKFMRNIIENLLQYSKKKWKKSRKKENFKNYKI